MFGAGRDRLEGYRWLKIGLDPPRAELYARIDARCREMFRHGLLEETAGILAMGYSPSCKPFQSLGYAQALRVIQGTSTVEEAIADTQLQTRRYAKRQMTWFRRETGMTWIRRFGEDAFEEAGQEIRSFFSL
jgi:tRNA dimethylallyltransferase